MAVVLSGTDVFLRATGLSIDWDGNAGTAFIWVKRSASGNATYATPFAMSSDASRTLENAIITDTTWKVQRNGDAASNITAYSADVWQVLGFSVSADGNSKYVYYGNASGVTRATADWIGLHSAYAYLTLGQTANEDQAGTQYNGKLAYLRLYDAQLSEAGFLAEAQNSTPAGSCVYQCPLIANGTPTIGSGSFSATAASGTATYDADTPYSVSAVTGRSLLLGIG
jgi:hypothetical protein